MRNNLLGVVGNLMINHMASSEKGSDERMHARIRTLNNTPPHTVHISQTGVHVHAYMYMYTWHGTFVVL